MAMHQNATLNPPASPQYLVTQNQPPTALVIYRSIPINVQYNLWRVISENVRYEGTTYGYFNSASFSIFPPEQRFQVNPQYPSRPTRPPVVQGHQHRISISSVGDICIGRGCAFLFAFSNISLAENQSVGREPEMHYPDFMISKPLPRPPQTPRVNCPVAVVEIKNLNLTDNLSLMEALKQTQKYSERLSESAFSIKPPDSSCIETFLVYGERYSRLRQINTPAGNFWNASPWQFVFEEMALPARAPLLYRLSEIAERHWQYDGY